MRCLAGHVYPGRPLEVWYAGCWQLVTQVLDEQKVPSGRRYHVICDETNEFWLEYHPLPDDWQVTAVTGYGN